MRSHYCRRMEGVLMALQLCCCSIWLVMPHGCRYPSEWALFAPSASCCVLCSFPLRPTGVFWVHSWTGDVLGLTLILDEGCWHCKLISFLAWFALWLMSTCDGVFSSRLFFVIGGKRPWGTVHEWGGDCCFSWLWWSGVVTEPRHKCGMMFLRNRVTLDNPAAPDTENM